MLKEIDGGAWKHPGIYCNISRYRQKQGNDCCSFEPKWSCSWYFTGVRRSVNSEWYCKVPRLQLFEQFRKGSQITGLRGKLVHHDNVSSPLLSEYWIILQDSGVQLLTNPSYTAELIPCGFVLPNCYKNDAR